MELTISQVYEASQSRLWEKLPKNQIDAVFSQQYCDIDTDFLGFVAIYENLSQVIPKHFIVVDLGCAYNPQCFFFEDHKEYIAVDVSDSVKFKSTNCRIIQATIQDFIENQTKELNLDETFAICSYVPPWGADNGRLAREFFKNVFVYYPHGYKVQL